MNLKPEKWDLPSVVVGDTYPATQFTYDGDGTLTRVRVKIKDADGTLALNLDSDSTGMTITTATDGAWDFTLDAIPAATTAGLAAGSYNYDLETTASSGVRTLLAGSWELIAQITD